MNAPARVYRTRAIVIRGRIFGEADRIVHLLSFEHGKIEAVAKGVRRPRTKLAGRLELGSEVQLELHRGRRLDVITDAELVHAHWQRLLEPAAFMVMTLALELVDGALEVNDPHPRIYELLAGMLTAIPRYPDPAVLMPRFEMRLLEGLGLAPQADFCVRCGAVFIERGAVADVDEGGLLCESCAPGRGGMRLSPAEVADFAALGRDADSNLPVKVQVSGRVAAVTRAYVLHYLGRRPRSEEILARLLEAAPASAETAHNE